MNAKLIYSSFMHFLENIHPMFSTLTVSKAKKVEPKETYRVLKS